MGHVDHNFSTHRDSCFDQGANELSDFVIGGDKGKGSGISSRDNQEVFDHPSEVLRLLMDYSDHLLQELEVDLFGLRLLEDGGGETLDPGEGSSELVREPGDQLIFGAGEVVGAAKFRFQALTVEAPA